MSNRTINLTDQLYDYMISVSLREPPLLERLRKETSANEMARMQISPEQGQFMAILIKLIGARRTLEIGVYTGYSCLCTALAMPGDGRIVACDTDEGWTDMAKRYWKEAGVADKIDLVLGPASKTLEKLIENGQEDSFDFAFIDADKENYDLYYEYCLRLVRPGGLIALDNVLWGGSVIDPSINDADTEAIRALNRKIYRDTRVDISLVPISDGLTIVMKQGL